MKLMGDSLILQAARIYENLTYSIAYLKIQ